MTDHQITCPGCGQPLHVPATALGQPGRCPHCRAFFRLPTDADGQPELVRRVPVIPRVLVVPGFGLLMLGLAGTLVNGYLSARMELEPGFVLAHARTQVAQIRSIEELSSAMKSSDDWPHAPRAAAGGAVAAQATIATAGEAADEQRAIAAAPSMKPVHIASTVVSALALLGGVSILRGRWYPLALLGCVAAILNVNHLCCLPGAVTGVWGVMALMRDDVRAFFKRVGEDVSG